MARPDCGWQSLFVEARLMTDTIMQHRIPDVALHCVSGIDIDPADLRGQRVAVFFCPRDSAAAAREIDSYRAVAEALAGEGVWLLGIVQGPLPADGAERRDGTHVSLSEDLDGCAWRHFSPALDAGEAGDEADGAAFFFERWGTLRRAWAGSGHAQDILDAARERG